MLFVYQALNPDGSITEDKGEFPGIQSLIETLSSQDRVLITYKSKRFILSDVLDEMIQPEVTRLDIVELCESLSSMVGSGLPLLDSLASIRDTIRKVKLRKALERVIDDIASGESLSGAFASQPKVFPRMLVFFCSIGEETGTIQEALKNTADHIKRVDDIVSQTRRALIYPSFVITAMGAVMFFWLFFVLPSLVETFKQMGVALPGITLKVIHGVAFMKEYWFLFPIMAALLGLGIVMLKKNERTNLHLARLAFRLPVAGNLLKCSSLTLMFSNMSLMLRSGVTLTKCFEILETTFRNPAVISIVESIRKSTNSGNTLTNSFSETKFFDPITLRMISVGESTGTLDQRLAYLTDLYQERTSRFVDVMGKMVEPIVMALAGGLFVFIVVSLIGPVYDLISQVRGG
ncbi:MAG TPA: type II secretion system F family protein [Deltaproteobacteria bacterium]|nr:type II secretion system F family protein [Deltaproteobacteria bacterium]HOI05809.1 type II secretion system F family protein [Deltaproteobacteria bacterium]